MTQPQHRVLKQSEILPIKTNMAPENLLSEESDYHMDDEGFTTKRKRIKKKNSMKSSQDAVRPKNVGTPAEDNELQDSDSDSNRENKKRNTDIGRSGELNQNNTGQEVENDDPLVIIRAKEVGAFLNPKKTLQAFSDSIFVKKLVGQLSVKGKGTSIHFRVCDLTGLDGLENINALGDIPVKVWVSDRSVIKGARTNRSYQGVITPISLELTDEEIFADLKKHCENLVFVKRIKGGSGPSTSIKLIFNNALPESIQWHFQSFKVRLYRPAPLRCYRCQKLGHGTGTCVNKPTCGKCFDTHVTERCSKSLTPKCLHCGEEHMVGNRFCKFTKMAQEIEISRASGEIDYTEYQNKYRELNKLTNPIVVRKLETTDTSSTAHSALKSNNDYTTKTNGSIINNPVASSSGINKMGLKQTNIIAARETLFSDVVKAGLDNFKDDNKPQVSSSRK